MLTLAIGDLYIPDRSIDIPEKFRKLLAPMPHQTPSNSKIAQVLCLGNITNSFETLQFLHNISPSFELVKGEFDDTNVLGQQLAQLEGEQDATVVPSYKIITVDGLRIGFTNGYQIVPKNDPLSLSALAREWDVDVLIWGGSHRVEAYILDGKFFINPGSGTGAFSFDWPEESDEESEDDESETESQDEIKEEIEETAPKDSGDEPEETKEETVETKETEETKDKETTVEEAEPKEGSPQSEDAKTPESDKPKEDAEPVLKQPPKELSKEDITEMFKTEAAQMPSNTPSFCLLETYNSTCTLYIYTYLQQEVKVDKVIYHKNH